MRSFALSAVALFATLPAAYAQTHTACNPLNTTGCPSMQALGGNATFNWTDTGVPLTGKVWSSQNDGTFSYDQDSGATFIINESGDAPEVLSQFYMFFGRMEVVMRPAVGIGIVSSAILQSEDLDEIDIEFIGGNSSQVMTNYFGKGNTTGFDRGQNFKLDFNAQDGFHNYTVDWTRDRIQWWVDGQMLRELTPAQALNGRNYPQTPMNIRLGCWAGGDTKNNAAGVVQWAGGPTDFSKAPFVMTVQSVYAQDYTNGSEYTWNNMDASGDWEKVQVIPGVSKVLKYIQQPAGFNRWKALPPAAKIGIAAGALAVLAVALIFITVCCIKQRRAGRREYAANLLEEQKQSQELEMFKRQMQNGKFGMGSTVNRV